MPEADRGFKLVLDASAMLALLFDEDGAQPVADAIASGAAIGVVNLAEVLTKLAAAGADPSSAAEEICTTGRSGQAVSIEPLTVVDCVSIARLREKTRTLGLSLADRACLALAMRFGIPVLTSDRTWADAALSADIRLIR